MDLFGQDFGQVVPKKGLSTIDPKTKRFNTLLKKIATLEKKVVETKNSCDAVFTVYKTKLEPLIVASRDLRIRLIKAAYYAIPKLKLSKNQMEDATQMMIDELDEIGFQTELDDDMKKIYESLNNVSIDDTLKQGNQLGAEMLADMLKNEGVDIDITKYDLGKLGRQDPEEIAKFLKDMMDFEKKSLKSLYTSLAKILHPDTEHDADLKLEKEEWMKQLTVAYNDQDLATMIRIELHWLQNSKFDPATAPERQFNTYISFLNERVQELNYEINTVAMHPKYMQIIDFIPKGKYMYNESIDDAIEAAKTSNIHFNKLVDLLNSNDVSSNRKKKAELINYVDEFWAAKDDMNYDFFDDDDYDDFDEDDFR